MLNCSLSSFSSYIFFYIKIWTGESQEPTEFKLEFNKSKIVKGCIFEAIMVTVFLHLELHPQNFSFCLYQRHAWFRPSVCPSVCLPACLSLSVCVCVHTCIDVFAYLCIRMWRPEISIQSIFLSGPLPHLFGTSSQLARKSQSRLHRLGSELPGLACLCLPGTGIISMPFLFFSLSASCGVQPYQISHLLALLCTLFPHTMHGF